MQPTSTPLGSLRALLMRTYSARMRSLARRRMWSGHYGRSNHGQRLGYRVDLGPGSALTLFHGMAGWAVREFENLGITATLVIRRLRGAHSLPEGADLTTLPDGVEILAEAPPSAD